MKGLFKPKSRTPVEVVRLTRDHLVNLDINRNPRDAKREEKIAELGKLIREMKSILYGSSDMEPAGESCAQLTQEFFRENTMRLLVVCLPKLNLEARKDVTQVIANLQRQQVHSRLIASDYLEANKDLMDLLVSGYDDMEIALHYGAMLRDCIRHQSIARYVLESEHMKKFFDYIQLPNFDIASDAFATFKELLTRHKSTVAEFLSKNYDWFFEEFNSKLLESPNYITRRQAIKLLGDILLDRSNSPIMMQYVSSKDNLMVLMNLLRLLGTTSCMGIGDRIVMVQQGHDLGAGEFLKNQARTFKLRHFMYSSCSLPTRISHLRSLAFLLQTKASCFVFLVASRQRKRTNSLK